MTRRTDVTAADQPEWPQSLLGVPPDRTGGAGRCDPPTPGPPVPPPTAGAADPDTAPAVAPPGHWAAALTGRRAHYVPGDTDRDWHYSRPVGLALDGWYALTDTRGLADGALLPRCSTCTRELNRQEQ